MPEPPSAREHGLGAMPGTRPATGRPRRTTAPGLAGLCVVVLVLGALFAVSPASEVQRIRELTGLASDPFDSPPEFTPGEGQFAFLNTQSGSGRPVGYDPCSPIRYVVNVAQAPPDWRELVETGAAHTSWATGLELVYAGTTLAVPFAAETSTPRSGDPVVIGFADEEQVPGLAGNVAGLGGSVARAPALGLDYRYDTGQIALDTDVFDSASTGERRRHLQAIVDHEFAHLVGLDHVGSDAELMAEGAGSTTYGPGDLEGLARLGDLPCR